MIEKIRTMISIKFERTDITSFVWKQWNVYYLVRSTKVSDNDRMHVVHTLRNEKKITSKTVLYQNHKNIFNMFKYKCGKQK